MIERAEDIRKRLKLYAGIFVALLGLTGVTVGIFYLFHPSGTRAIFIALLISATQAALAGAYFMHLNSEKKLIYRVLLITGLLFLVLMLLTLLAVNDQR